MKKKYRKITSALLCILAITMIVLAFPIQAFADEPNESTGPSVLEPTAVIPNPDYDPDADEDSLGTPSLESIPGAGAVDPMVIDPPGGGLIPIGPTNDPIDSGVYTIVSYSNQKVVDVESGGTTAGTKVQQRSASTSVDRNQLFKIAFLTTINNQHYYSVRSMTNSALGLSTSATNGNVTLQAMSTIDTYNDIDTEHRWIITAVDTGVYTFQNANSLGGYLSNGGSTTDGQQLITVSSSSSNCFWTLEQYDGDILQGYGWNSAHTTLIPGETATYSAYMYSSIVNRNGPVTYSLYKDFEAVSDYATINASTGAVTAIKSGDIQVRALPYPNASEILCANVEIVLEANMIHVLENTVINDHVLYYDADDTETPIQVKHYIRRAPYTWRVEGPTANGYFRIYNDSNNLYLQSPISHSENAKLQLSQYADSYADLYYWRFIKTSDGYYLLQSKYQAERNTDNPLYVVYDSQCAVQSSDVTYGKWKIRPLILRYNVMFDAAFAERFGSDYQTILQSVFGENSIGHSIPDIFGETYGITVRITYNFETSFKSYTYTQECKYRYSINSICHDCKNAEVNDLITECQNGLHHKNEIMIFDSLPSSGLSASHQINILFTGQTTCYIINIINDEDETITQEHIDDCCTFGLGAVLGNTILINFNKLYDELVSDNNDKYNQAIAIVAHETLHNLGAEHCQNGCIMGNSNDNFEKNLTMCNTCQTTVENNKFALYQHE